MAYPDPDWPGSPVEPEVAVDLESGSRAMVDLEPEIDLEAREWVDSRSWSRPDIFLLEPGTEASFS